MIYGIGIDIVEISRIKKIIKKWKNHFLNRIFCPEEIAHFKDRQDPSQNYAGRFAGKEAVIKALGEMPKNIDFRDIKIERELSGKPILIFSPALKKYLDKKKIRFYHISISHSEKYAIAQVILETK